MTGKNSFLKQKRFWVVVLPLFVLILLIIVVNSKLSNSSSKLNIRSEGQLRLINITSGVENSLKGSENLVKNYAAQLEIILENNSVSSDILYRYIDKQDQYLKEESNNQCFSSYIAYNDKLYIKNFVPDDSFRLTERVWYVGAKKKQGQVYISDPYIDANTGSMCYSMSMQLNDGKTIVGLDFVMDGIQEYIVAMTEEINGMAMIVNESGMILGHNNPEYVGLNTSEIRDYNNIFTKVASFYGDFFEYDSDDNINYTIFSDKTDYGWYLIVCLPSNYLNATTNKGSIFYNIILVFLFFIFVANYIYAFRKEWEDDNKKDRAVQPLKHKRYAFYIVLILCLAMSISIVVNTYTQSNNITSHMIIEEDKYYSRLQSWVDTNITLTNDLALHLGAQPELYKDYNAAVEYINNVVKDNQDISVAYIVNPSWEHAVIMNNGWESTDPNWHVEERDWYVDTILSGSGFNISTPYQDEQTGMYCVTFSQIVYDAHNEIIGLIGIDFYMDALIDILGESYSKNGYAFLTDTNYVILNHPNDKYQMSVDNSVNATDTKYRNALIQEKVTFLRDYDGVYKLALVKREGGSGFSVITISDAWSMYRTLVVTDLILFVIFIVSIFSILFITNMMTKFQNRMNVQLQNAVDAAIAAGNAKSNFLANMSHEIRTPINAILGMNEMILRESESDSVLGYSRDIRSAGKTLLSIINDILDFSKIESGKMEIVEASYETASMINDLVNIISDRAAKKNLEFKLEIDERIPETLYGDDVRIRQIITNLLTNAVKYTPNGSVTLTIKLWDNGDLAFSSDADNIVSLYIAVSDTGQGIKETDIGKLFDSFTRIDEKKNRTIEGTGLGISIVSRLLELMNSRLQVQSEYGKGSVFYFSLDQKVISSKPIGNLKQRLMNDSIGQDNSVILQRTAKDVKVLIVDDTEMNLRVEANLLKRTQVSIDTAESGAQALVMIKDNKYDVIFLDHMMPEMDGIETIAEARKQNILGSTPVIALTANAVAGARQQYIDSGFDNYLSKPVDGQTMEDMLFSYIDDSRITVVEMEVQKPRRSRNKKSE